jgi:hypothetical protein
MRWLLYLFLGVALIAAGFVWGYLWPHKASVGRAQGCFEVSDVKLQRPLHSGLSDCSVFPCIVGTVRNSCNQRFNTIWLTYNLYDGAGIQVGSTDAIVENLEPHGTARFWTALSYNAPKSPKFKLTKISVEPTQ